MVQSITIQLKKILKYFFIASSAANMLLSIIDGENKAWIFFMISTFVALPQLDNFIRLKKNYKYFIAVSSFIIGCIIVVPEREAIVTKEKSQKDSLINSQNQLVNHQKEQQIIEERRLYNFQILWADSVVKSWNGSFIIGSKVNKPNQIVFEFGMEASKTLSINRNNQILIYQSLYNEDAIRNGFKSNNCNIDFVMNSKIDISKWDKTSLLWIDAKIYSGSSYDKKYLGRINRKVILNGVKTVEIRTDKNGIIYVPWDEIIALSYYYEREDLKSKKENHSTWVKID